MVQKKTTIFFILTTLAVFLLPQMAIDLYLPSLPTMTSSLNTSSFFLQLTLTVYILPMGITSLIYGPSSDRFGRKPILIIGMAIFLIGCILASFATSISLLLIFRVLQGLGIGCGFAVASAILGDSFTGKRLAKMTTFSSMIYSLSPILAPVLGGYLQHYIGWQANFVFMAICSILLLIAIIFFIPETNIKPDFDALKCKNLIFNYLRMFKSLIFIGNVASLTFAFGIMVTFNIVGPFLLQNVLKVSVVTYGQLLLLVGVSYFIGTSLNSQLLKFFKINTLRFCGLFLMLLFSIAIILSGYIGWFTVTSIILFTCLEMASIGFVFPNCFAKALEVFPQNLGVAGALIGSLGLIGTSIISVIVAHIHSTQEQSLGYMFLVQALLAMIFSFLSFKPDKSKKLISDSRSEHIHV